MDLKKASLKDLQIEINRREQCEKMPKKNLILLGPPGSGKGTQSIKLLNDFCYCQLSTGDLLRDAVKNKTVGGIKAKEAMDKGQLVTNEIIFEIIENEMKSPACERGIIFDGFPRTAEQAESLGNFLNNIGRNLDLVFELKVNEEELYERAEGRRIHLSSGRTYHITKNPPKVEGLDDVTGEPLIHRSDDTREVIKSRMDIYYQKTLPVSGYYEKMGLLKKVDSMQSIEKVYSDIKSGLMH
jgi:adenylate kinase